jgi:hypothetical protein
VLFTSSGKTLIKYPSAKPEGDYAIPDGTESISVYAFHSCTNLSNIAIPYTVTGIDSCAFFGCSGLVSVIIPDSVIHMGVDVFENCTGLTVCAEAASRPTGWEENWHSNRPVVLGYGTEIE